MVVRSIATLWVPVLLTLVRAAHGAETPHEAATALRDADSSLVSLLDSLQGGPIEVRTADPPTGIARETAVQAARVCLGLDDLPAKHVWAGVVTDSEFMGGWLEKRSCWITEHTVEAPWQAAEVAGATTTFYAVIDAETGVCWEVFTKPQAPWWDNVAIKGPSVVRRFGRWGEKAAPATAFPKTGLSRVLVSAVKDVRLRTYLAKAQQMIARFFRHTTRGKGRGTLRIEGLEVVPRLADHPVWLISLEGIDAPWPGSHPGSSGAEVRMPNIQEANITASAVTGELLGWGHYR